MTRQERAARASKWADQQADTIIAEATTRATDKTARAVKLTEEQALDRRKRDSAAIRGTTVEPAKRCPVCRTTGTLVELKAAGHGKGCTEKPPCQHTRGCAGKVGHGGTCPVAAPQIDAKARTKLTAGARVVTRPEAHSEDLGARCVQMRDEGAVSWAAIGAALGLPGAKTGAAAARKLYAAHTGKPHTSAPGPTRAPRASTRHAAQVGSKTARREVAQRQGGFFSDDMPDEDVVALVHGKTVEWVIDLARLAGGKGEPQWAEQEARVHPTDVYVKEVNGERCLNFRTLEGWYEPDPKTGDSAPIAGPTRTVRLAAIHTVR